MIQPIDEDAIRRDLAQNPSPISPPISEQTLQPQYDIGLSQLAAAPLVPQETANSEAADRFEKDEEREQKSARKWKCESLLINIFAILVVSISALGILSSAAGENDFFVLAFNVIGGLLGLLLLGRLDMARRVIVVFMLLNIAFQVLPFIGFLSFNIISVALSLVVIIFLKLSAIKRHF